MSLKLSNCLKICLLSVASFSCTVGKVDAAEAPDLTRSIVNFNPDEIKKHLYPTSIVLPDLPFEGERKIPNIVKTIKLIGDINGHEARTDGFTKLMRNYKAAKPEDKNKIKQEIYALIFNEIFDNTSDKQGLASKLKSTVDNLKNIKNSLEIAKTDVYENASLFYKNIDLYFNLSWLSQVYIGLWDNMSESYDKENKSVSNQKENALKDLNQKKEKEINDLKAAMTFPANLKDSIMKYLFPPENNKAKIVKPVFSKDTEGKAYTNQLAAAEKKLRDIMDEHQKKYLEVEQKFETQTKTNEEEFKKMQQGYDFIFKDRAFAANFTGIHTVDDWKEYYWGCGFSDRAAPELHAKFLKFTSTKAINDAITKTSDEFKKRQPNVFDGLFKHMDLGKLLPEAK